MIGMRRAWTNGALCSRPTSSKHRHWRFSLSCNKTEKRSTQQGTGALSTNSMVRMPATTQCSVSIYKNTNMLSLTLPRKHRALVLSIRIWAATIGLQPLARTSSSQSLVSTVPYS